LKTIYPEYSGQVNFYAIAVSKNFDNLERLENYRERNGHPWPVANIADEQSALAELNVAYQSTKIAFDSRGIIIYRDGFGGGGTDTWRQVFTELANQ
jgi:hypothetical protein